MSSTTLNQIGNTNSYDFTDALTKAYLNGQKDLTNGYFGMTGGVSDGNGTVDGSDKDVNWNCDVGTAGYYGSDLNLDSEVDNVDKNDIWNTNVGEESKVPMAQ